VEVLPPQRVSAYACHKLLVFQCLTPSVTLVKLAFNTRLHMVSCRWCEINSSRSWV